MHIKPLILFLSVFAPAFNLLAGEHIPLEEDFSFRLNQNGPAPSLSVPFPDALFPSERNHPNLFKTRHGERLPPGVLKREFNGQPYYVILLQA